MLKYTRGIGYFPVVLRSLHFKIIFIIIKAMHNLNSNNAYRYQLIIINNRQVLKYFFLKLD